jgi:hypothetical protein
MEKDGPLDGDVAAGTMTPPWSAAEVFFLGTERPLSAWKRIRRRFSSRVLLLQRKSAVREKEELNKD